jgi:hypothetical protein
VEWAKLEAGYRKVEANWKFLEFVVTMDMHELKIMTKWAKHFEKENTNLDVRLHSQAKNLKKTIETIEWLQLSVQELSCHAPIT